VDLIERGNGPALVVIPGLQGRWEYLRPAVDALAESFRVLTFSLDDVRTDPELDGYAEHVAAVMNTAGVERATICGISFGGLVAVRFAALYPKRCDALVLASTPQPRLRLRPRHELYLRAPWIFGLFFLVETPFRLHSEIVSAIPDAAARRRFMLRSLRTVVAAPVSLGRMAARARAIVREDVASDCARIGAPTLVVTGERGLDHVVPVEGSSEYLALIANARAAVIERTGHLGTITRPEAFSALVHAFLAGHHHAAA
jgi:3-oxoadipate enol-lactonase/4-carboxymuconolactone decarboxylase